MKALSVLVIFGRTLTTTIVKTILSGLALWTFTPTAFARDLARLESEEHYQKAQLRIGENKFTAYIADDDDKRSSGLMFIEKLPSDVGMLFVFAEEKPISFWMKNTMIPLSIGFFNSRGILLDVQEMKIASSILMTTLPSYQSRGPAQFALEMNAGWFAQHKVKKGARLVLDGKATSDLLLNKLSPVSRSRR